MAVSHACPLAFARRCARAPTRTAARTRRCLWDGPPTSIARGLASAAYGGRRRVPEPYSAGASVSPARGRP
eukprot:5926035-Alexandrium_andersonii.AAC.1